MGGRINYVLSSPDIVNTIMAVAARLQDPSPTGIQYVYGTRNDLNTFIAQATIDGADGERQAVLVQAIGSFTWIHSAPKPIHGPAHNKSTGTAIWLIIDQQTGHVTDQGIGQAKDLAPLGQVFLPAVPKKAT